MTPQEFGWIVAESAMRRAGMPFGDSRLCRSIVEAVEDHLHLLPDVSHQSKEASHAIDSEGH